MPTCNWSLTTTRKNCQKANTTLLWCKTEFECPGLNASGKLQEDLASKLQANSRKICMQLTIFPKMVPLTILKQGGITFHHEETFFVFDRVLVLAAAFRCCLLVAELRLCSIDGCRNICNIIANKLVGCCIHTSVDIVGLDFVIGFQLETHSYDVA